MTFESSVISYGSKTNAKEASKRLAFESSVISYGSKTKGSFVTVENKV